MQPIKNNAQKWPHSLCHLYICSRFDEFNLVRQAVLLTIDTFGFSHIVPIIGLPFLVACQRPLKKTDQKKQVFYSNLLQVSFIFSKYISIGNSLVGYNFRKSCKTVFEVVGFLLLIFRYIWFMDLLWLQPQRLLSYLLQYKDGIWWYLLHLSNFC